MGKIGHMFYMALFGLITAIMVMAVLFISFKVVFGGYARAASSEDSTLYDPHGPGHHYNQLFEIFDEEPARPIWGEDRRFTNTFEDEREDEHNSDDNDDNDESDDGR